MLHCCALVRGRTRSGIAALLGASALAAACGTRPPEGLPVPGAAPVGCQHCTPDPGSAYVDFAAQEAGLEFSHLNRFTGSNTGMYTYTDRTAVIDSLDTGWAATALAQAYGREGVAHLKGGPFLAWGGGFGMAMKDSPQMKDCGFTDSAGKGFCAHDMSVPESAAIIDVSEWEGISLWARRGPESQGGVRVAIGDKYTDDDVSYIMYSADPARPRFCERVRECACTNHKPCSEYTSLPTASYASQPNAKLTGCPATGGGYFCGNPVSDLWPAERTTGLFSYRCLSCSIGRCDEPYDAYPDGFGGTLLKDSQFNGRPCTPFTYRNGISSSFCYDPAKDPPPAQPDEQCGDHWNKVVSLSTDWRLYLVPFSSMTQQGFAKKSNKLDLQAVSVVRLTWDGGWIDYYIDDLAFYRHKK